MLTRQEFNALTKGRKIVDGNRREWEVLYADSIPGGHSDVPGELEVSLRAPDGGEMVVGWWEDCEQPGIYDEEFGRVLELNSPKTYLVPV